MSVTATMVAVLTTATIQKVVVIVLVVLDLVQVAQTVMVSENCLCVSVKPIIFND